MNGSKSAGGQLEAQAYEQFDALVKKGEIFWAPTEEIKVEQQPFDVSLATTRSSSLATSFALCGSLLS